MTQAESHWTDPDDADVWTVDRLLDGEIAASEAPGGYGQVATLIAVIREGVAPAPSGWGSPTVPAMARVITAPPPPRRRSGGLTHARRLSHAAAAVGVFALLGSGTAAATGSLPASVQTVVHSAAATLGVSIPRGDQFDRHGALTGGRHSYSAGAQASAHGTSVTTNAHLSRNLPQPASAPLPGPPPSPPPTRSDSDPSSATNSTLTTPTTIAPVTTVPAASHEGSGNGDGTTVSVGPPTTLRTPGSAYGQSQGTGHTGSAGRLGSQNRSS